jgi:hypothetical protein
MRSRSLVINGKSSSGDAKFTLSGYAWSTPAVVRSMPVRRGAA